jgi:hypothetical protein
MEVFCSSFYENKILNSKIENKILKQDFDNQYSDFKLSP